jgi:hypothetical protein
MALPVFSLPKPLGTQTRGLPNLQICLEKLRHCLKREALSLPYFVQKERTINLSTRRWGIAEMGRNKILGDVKTAWRSVRV